MKLSQTPAGVTAGFDDEHLIGHAGLVPAMRLAEKAGLHRLVLEHVRVPGDKGANPHLKVASLVAGMVAGADSIDDMDLIRHGGMDKLFGGARAPSTLGSFLRAFTFGHSRQVDAVASRLLLGLDRHSRVFGPSGAAGPVMADVDDTVVEVFSADKQGAGIGYSNVRGLDALLMTVSGDGFAPVVVADRLREGSAHSVRGATRLVRDGLALVGRSSLAGRQVWLRADSGFYSCELVRSAAAAGAWVSVTVKLDKAVKKAIPTIPETSWTRIDYPHPVWDDDSRQWVSRAEVAETEYTAFKSRSNKSGLRAPGRLVVRRVPDWNAKKKAEAGQDPLFAAWRFHALFTTVPTDSYDTTAVDKLHRGHAVIEQVNAALKDSALAHLPSGRFPANTVWLTLACIAFNLTRALATLTGDPRLAVAAPATIRRTLIQVPARIASKARRVVLHLPLNWKWATSWMTAFTATHRPLPA